MSIKAVVFKVVLKTSKTWKNSVDTVNMKYFPPTTGMHCCICKIFFGKKSTTAKKTLKNPYIDYIIFQTM